MKKIDHVRRLIYTLCDRHHAQRVSDLLDLLEEEIGGATIDYVAKIADVVAEDAGRAWGGPNAAQNNRAAQIAAERVASALRYAEWRRGDVIATQPDCTLPIKDWR